MSFDSESLRLKCTSWRLASATIPSPRVYFWLLAEVHKTGKRWKKASRSTKSSLHIPFKVLQQVIMLSRTFFLVRPHLRPDPRVHVKRLLYSQGDYSGLVRAVLYMRDDRAIVKQTLIIDSCSMISLRFNLLKIIFISGWFVLK